jgi:hypothetical protein
MLVALGLLVLPACGGKTPAGDGGKTETSENGESEADTDAGSESDSESGGSGGCQSDEDCPGRPTGICEGGSCVECPAPNTSPCDGVCCAENENCKDNSGGCSDDDGDVEPNWECEPCVEQGGLCEAHCFGATCCGDIVCEPEDDVWASFCGGPIPDPEDQDCDIWDTESCPDGYKCTAWADMGTSWNANNCRMIMGAGQPGEDCQATDGSGVSGNDTCEKGSMCWDIDADTQTGYCVAFCTGDANNPMCADTTICAVYNDGVVPVCLPTCDPLMAGAECPDPDNVCIETPGSEGFACALFGEGMGTAGTDCMYPNSCNQGLACIDAAFYPGCGATGCCSEFCDLNDDPNGDNCACKGQGCTCMPYWQIAGWGQNPVGWEHVGACGIP